MEYSPTVTGAKWTAETLKDVLAGDQDAMKAALQAAKQRIAATQGRDQPGRPADYDRLGWGNGHEQRRAMASAGLDMTRAPLAPGGVMTRSESGQVTVKYPEQATCELGHPAEPGHRL